MSTVTPNLGLFKYDTTNPTDLAAAFNINTALNSNWDIIDNAIHSSGGTSRNIGEIVTSTIPLTDAGLHLLDGSLIQGDGIYSDFVGYIAGLDLTANYFCTETEWQQSITDYGVCGKFVYDSINNTVRLPKYSNKIYTQDIDTTAPVVGNGNVLGLTSLDNQSAYCLGYTTYGNLWLSNSEAPVTLPSSVSNSFPYSAALIGIGVSPDPTKSGIIADLSNITASLEGYYYIVVATSTKTSIEVDIDEIATDLNGKADTDLTNVNNQAKILMSGMGMPSDKYIDLTLNASGSTYIAPSNGYIYLNKTAGSDWYYIEGTVIRNGIALYGDFDADYRTSLLKILLPVLKGDNIKIRYNATGTTNYFRFIYAVGSESEAS